MSKNAILDNPGVETAEKLGLLPQEYDKICEILGRKPNFTELSIYSVMWSEHCSYKNSISWLKKLPKTGKRVLAGAGEENAGLMDIGDGLAVCFKIESHNHPSAIEPYQGAATGVGGIQRDIFSMGARPIASLNSLRFGNPKHSKTKHLIKGVVKGIGDYGNAFGVPTVGGEVYFDECYHTNPLVNAMSVGVVDKDKTASAIAEGIGNPVFIVGSATGKDGIHGATFASGDITEDSHNDLPSVQVGDPFTEKLLLEVTLEIIESGIVVGIQDMGAAGITCSTSEMSAKGECGMDVWLDKVPMRQEGMKPFEILLSESQERMLIVIKKGTEEKIKELCEKWDLPCEEIGVVTKGSNIRYFMNGVLEAEVPGDTLVLGGGAPVYERTSKEPAYLKEIDKFDLSKVKEPKFEEYDEIIEEMLRNPSISSKRWITEQYDSMVGRANLSSNLPADAAVVHILGTDKALAMTTDCNSRYVAANPQRGTAMAVCEAIRNLICAGAEPLGVTNCLNFGNPYNEEVYWQFSNAILGMTAACEKFSLPVTGGNVSFYNQSTDDGPVYPTPTIGMVGLIENVNEPRYGMAFQKEGDTIYLLGHNPEDLGCSEYLYTYHGIKHSPAPYFNLSQEFELYQLMSQLKKERLIESAHDISEGGLIINLLESSFPNELGFEIEVDDELRLDAFLFGEAGGRIVITVSPNLAEEFEQIIDTSKVPCLLLGTVTGDEVIIDGEFFGAIDELKVVYDNTLQDIINE